MLKSAALAASLLASSPLSAMPNLKADSPPFFVHWKRDKLDLPIHPWEKFPYPSPAFSARNSDGWVPGDPRNERTEPIWVQHVSHAGYMGIGAAGLAASLASGGTAPAIGFAVVTVVQSFREWRLIRAAAKKG